MRALWFRRAKRAAELDEEIRAHLRMSEAERIARGETPEAAAAAARREFGNVTHIKEVTREMWGGIWLDRLAQDVRYALRSLQRSPGFASVVVLTLALGIGINSAMFTVVYGVLLRPLPFARPDRLQVISYKPDNAFMTQPGLFDGHYLQFKEQSRSFQSLATFTKHPMTLTGAGEPARLTAAAVTPEFTAVLGVAPAIGTAFSPDDGKPGQAPVVLLSDKLWRDRFAGDPRVVGKPIVLDGISYTAIGVMPAGFDFPAQAMLWRPIEVTVSPGNIMFRPVVGRLRDDVSPRQALAELEAIAARIEILHGMQRSELIARILPLKQFVVGCRSSFGRTLTCNVGSMERSLWVFAGAVGFVLLIACANVANLLLIRASSRHHEIAVRSALGAERRRLIRQLLTESAVIALLGGVLGVLLAVAGVRALVAFAPAGRIPRIDQIQVDSIVLLVTIGVSLLTGFVFGVVPALRATRDDLRDSLSQGGRTLSGRHGGLRSTFVVAEIALALVLLAGAGLMVRSFLHMRAVDLGFQPDNVVAMTVDLPSAGYPTAAAMQQFDGSLLERLARVPGVEAAGAVNWRPLGDMLVAGDFHLEGGRALPAGFQVDKPVVSAGYFRAMGIRVRSGRDFTERDDRASPGVAIISQSVADRLWPGVSPIGQRLTTEREPKPEDWLTIIGVVDDVVQQEVTSRPGSALYQPYTQVHHAFFLDHMTFAVRTRADPSMVVVAMRSALREVDKNQPAQAVATMRELVAAKTAEPLFQARLLGLFSVLALALAAIGIYGVLSYSVAERTREIGIRVALGAQGRDVARMVMRQTLALALPGVLLGVVGALAVTRVIGGLLFGVKPHDPLTLGVVAGLLATVALVAALVPARRAAHLDPLVALRSE